MALFRIDTTSNALGFSTKIVAIIPENVNEFTKTLYLLHGFNGTQDSYTRYTSIERYAREKGIAVIMPFGSNSWYTDMNCGLKYYQYIAEELPLIIKNYFPQLSTKKEDCFIAGNSMGGYGALKIAFNFPERYSHVGCFSGAFDVEDFARKKYNSNKSYWDSVFDSLDNIKNSNNDVYFLANKQKDLVKDIKFFLSCGEQDDLLGYSTKMANLLNNLDCKVEYTHSKGGHNWEFWDTQVKLFLDNII